LGNNEALNLNFETIFGVETNVQLELDNHALGKPCSFTLPKTRNSNILLLKNYSWDWSSDESVKRPSLFEI
jgi:hypothetical protein